MNFSEYRSILPIAVLAFLLHGCSSNDDDGTPNGDGNIDGSAVIESTILAAEGGVFSAEDGSITIDIPANSLAEDGVLQVIPVEGLSDPTDTMTSAGGAFAISFGAELLAPVSVNLEIDTPPTHPELAESAMIVEGEWVRSSANFFRASNNTVLSLISGDATLQPILRTLQAESGDQVERGIDVFLNSTFGNEQFFGDIVGLQDLLNNLSPSDALAVGAQIDISKVPADIVSVLTGNNFTAIQDALVSPALTRALLQADAVVGVRAFYEDESSDIATSAGITCALCHATVVPTEFELSEGEMTSLPIGPVALNGLPNTAIDVGTILSMTPFAINSGQETIDFLQGFGAGQFDARALPDNPLEDGALNPTNIPPLWNFVDLTEQDYTFNWDGFFGSSDEPNNALASRDELVFDLVMHANGAFGTDTSTVPLAAVNDPSTALVDALNDAEAQAPGNDIDQQPLLDLQSWERSLVSPAPGEFDEALAEEGFLLFYGGAQCSTCHLTAEFTGPVVTPSIVLEPPQGDLAGGIKTPGLRGISQTAPYFHDGSAATLEEMVEVYSGRITPELNPSEVSAIAEYMRSL